jgi:hypothetical protein
MQLRTACGTVATVVFIADLNAIAVRIPQNPQRVIQRLIAPLRQVQGKDLDITDAGGTSDCGVYSRRGLIGSAYFVFFYLTPRLTAAVFGVTAGTIRKSER